MENKTIVVGLPNGISTEQIALWKAKHGENKIVLIDLFREDEDDAFQVVGCIPPRIAIGEYEKFADRDSDKAKSILVNACILSGLDEVKSDDQLFLTAFNAIARLLPIGKSTVKPLTKPDTMTDESFSALCLKYGRDKLRSLTVSHEDGSCETDTVAVIPGRENIAEFEKYADTDPLKAKYKLLNCLVYGRELVKADDELFFATVNGVAKLIPIGRSEVKKL